MADGTFPVTDIRGHFDPEYEAVAAAFTENFATAREVGAAVTVYRQGREVVSLHGGAARPDQPWREDTLATVFSVSKGIVATVVAVLADRGLLDVDARVADYWPEFGDSGKSEVTIRQVLTHTAGVISFPGYLDLVERSQVWPDLEDIVAGIEGAAPYWPPGEGHGYHALTYGWILGQVVYKITGLRIGQWFREHIGEPFDIDFWFAPPKSEHDRIADLVDNPIPDHPMMHAYLSLFNPDTWTGQAHFMTRDGVAAIGATFNQEEIRSAEIPGGGGIGSARGIARLYALLANGGTLDGKRLLSAETIATHTAEQVRGHDRVLLVPGAFALGFARPSEFSPYVALPDAFGHSGLGGSVGFADPTSGVGFAYVPNALQFDAPGDITRAGRLVEALQKATNN